jgi:DNA/RNA-binding domain of Phe-tRNA-synthetase-like protein
MRIKLDSDFIARFPEATIHALVYDGVDRITAAIADRWRARAQAHMRALEIQPDRIIERDEIQEWRKAYSQFGLKPSKYRSSIEQLWRRAIQGKLIETGIPTVDTYCYSSIIAGSPMGAYDLNQVHGNLCIRLAQEGEEFIGIGEQQAVSVPAGVVVYADDAGVLCYGWNHRDAASSALRSETHRAIFFADSAHASSKARAANAISLLEEALEESCANFIVKETLTAEKPEVNISI